MKTRRVLITAGPTREYIDPVRYISNDSSGRMGFALAAAAAKLGAKVTLIAGPVSLSTPKNVKRIDVVSAFEMRREVMKFAPRSDVVIMAAAVADWRPARFEKKKIKRRGSKNITLKLKENPDILAELGRKKRRGQLIVGFALETEKLLQNAQKKLIKKNCDWIVANTNRSINSSSSQVVMISQNKKIPLPLMSKERLAVLILRITLSLTLSPQRLCHNSILSSRGARRATWRSPKINDLRRLLRR